jgi:hypothetical protein
MQTALGTLSRTIRDVFEPHRITGNFARTGPLSDSDDTCHIPEELNLRAE